MVCPVLFNHFWWSISTYYTPLIHLVLWCQWSIITLAAVNLAGWTGGVWLIYSQLLPISLSVTLFNCIKLSSLNLCARGCIISLVLVNLYHFVYGFWCRMKAGFTDFEISYPCANISLMNVNWLHLVPHICIVELGHHWFRFWLVTCLAPSHHLNQWWLLISHTPRNRLQWKKYQN